MGLNPSQSAPRTARGRHRKTALRRIRSLLSLINPWRPATSEPEAEAGEYSWVSRDGKQYAIEQYEGRVRVTSL
jgi:hypothetical protein